LISFITTGKNFIKKMNNILVVAPHPDDEIVGLGITIRKLLKKRKKISIFFPTNGVVSKNQMWFWERNQYKHLVSIRKKEMRKSLKILGVDSFYYQDIPTRTLKERISQTYEKIRKIIKIKKIDTIFCPAYEGGHQDHDITNFICSRFKRKIQVFEFAEYNFFKRKINVNKFIKSLNKEKIIILNENEKLYKKKLLAVYASEKKNLSFLSPNVESYRKITCYDYVKPPHKGTLFYRRFSFFSWHPRVDSDNPLKVCNLIGNSRIFLNCDF